MARICAVVGNSVSRDARVLKEAATLAAAGHEVYVVGVTDNDHAVPFETLGNGVRVLRLELRARETALREVVRAAVRIGAAAVLIAGALFLTLDQLLPFGLAAIALYLVYTSRRGVIGLWRAFARDTAIVRMKEWESPGFREGGWRALVSALAARCRLPVREWGRSWLMYTAVRAIRPDVVHCHDVHTLPVGALAKLLMGRKVVYDAHEIYEEVAQGNEHTASKYRRMHRRYLFAADRFITINDSIARWYAEHYPKLASAVVVMNATANSEPFEYDGRLHRAAGLSPDAKIVLYQGGYATKRGLHSLVQSAAHLPKGWTLVMMGWGRIEEELRAMADSLARRAGTGEADAPVRFVAPAPQAELALWSAGATVGIIPYEKVGLNHWFCTPNKLWEYPNAGVPVLVSPFPELRRPVEAYGCGWVLEEDWEGATLGRQIAGLSEADLAAAREGCRRFIAAENWDVYGARVLALYDDLLNEQTVSRTIPSSQANGS
jgi:glycosyltransferase involved in cell wall biosynthesis